MFKGKFLNSTSVQIVQYFHRSLFFTLFINKQTEYLNNNTVNQHIMKSVTEEKHCKHKINKVRSLIGVMSFKILIREQNLRYW